MNATLPAATVDVMVIAFSVQTHDTVEVGGGVAPGQPRLCSAAVFTFTRGDGPLLCVIELRPLPSRDRAMLAQLGASLAFGVAANVAWSVPDLRRIVVRAPEALHERWRDITATYATLTGVEITYEAPSLTTAIDGPSGDVFLLTGGKDTLWSLERHSRGRRERLPALYLAMGAELNWRQELPHVLRRAAYFGLDLAIFEVLAMYSSAKPVLRFANRAAWRELLTLSLARCYGSRIYTGINIDAVARLDLRAPHFSILLSQLLPALDAMQEVLGATIVTTPGEFTVYRDIRHHPLRADGGSCLSPACRPSRLCAKCEGLAIYDALLDGQPLTDAQRTFVRSDRFLGDAALFDRVEMAPDPASRPQPHVEGARG